MRGGVRMGVVRVGKCGGKGEGSIASFPGSLPP